MLGKSNLAAVINGSFQCFAIIAADNGLVWPLYGVILMMFYMAFMQTVAAASLFSFFVKVNETSSDGNDIIRAMIAILYIFSAYKVYIIGLEIISGVMIAHALIYLLTQIFVCVKVVRQESD